MNQIISKKDNIRPLRHELKHQINHLDDLVLSKRLRKIFPHDKYAGEDGCYTVSSLYFDTPYDKAYQDKINGVNFREKFRLRYYGRNLSFIRLEKKYKINGLCGKISSKLSLSEVKDLLKGNIDFLLDTKDPLFIEFYSKVKGQGLAPKTIVRYNREAFTYAPGNVRITLDRNVSTTMNADNFLNIYTSDFKVLDTTVLEVKYDNYLPDIARMAVQIGNRKASSCSKYTITRFYE